MPFRLISKVAVMTNVYHRLFIVKNKSTKINMQIMIRIGSNSKRFMQLQFKKWFHFLWCKKNHILMFAYVGKIYFGKILRI